MQMTADGAQAQAAIRVDLSAIFVSLELSRSTWLVTALSPGSEKMSRHSVSGGCLAELLIYFGELRRKAQARTGQIYPLVVTQEAGLDGFWIDRALSQEDWIESHVVDAALIAVPRRRRRAKTDRIDGETLIRALMAYKRGEPRVCSMVRVPTPAEEDRRRICRERKVLVKERTLHSNRIKGLLFSQGVQDYKPLRRDRRARLEELRTGDGRELPKHLKAQIERELDRLELLVKQIKAVEAERDAVMSTEQAGSASPAALLARDQRDRPGIRGGFDLRRLVPALRQSTTARRLCRACSLSLEERPNRQRTRCFQIWQSAVANDHEPARMAVAAPSTQICLVALVCRARRA